VCLPCRAVFLAGAYRWNPLSVLPGKLPSRSAREAIRPLCRIWSGWELVGTVGTVGTVARTVLGQSLDGRMGRETMSRKSAADLRNYEELKENLI
jgi:hypothetical protein